MSTRESRAHTRRGALVRLLAIASGIAAAVPHWRSFGIQTASCVSTTDDSGRAAFDARRNVADSTFALAMIAHHQVAIDMAQGELRDGRNEQLRRLAQEIIVTQQDEIAVMRLAMCRSRDDSTGRKREH